MYSWLPVICSSLPLSGDRALCPVGTSAVLYWSQPITNRCCGWIGHCGSCYDCKMPFRDYHQEILKKKKKGLLLTRNYTAHLRPQSKAMVGREGVHWPGVLLSLGPRVLWVQSSLVNLRHMSGNLKGEKRKNTWPKWSLTEFNTSKAWEPQGERACSLSTHCGLATLSLEIGVFEVDVSLKWLPQQSKLKSDTCIAKKKNTCQE